MSQARARRSVQATERDSVECPVRTVEMNVCIQKRREWVEVLKMSVEWGSQSTGGWLKHESSKET